MTRVFLLVVPGLALLAACSTNGTGTDPGPTSAYPNVTTSQSVSAVPTLPSKVLPAAGRPTPGVTVVFENVPLTPGDGLSIGLHPTEAPITIRAAASIPLTVCPDGDSRLGTGLSWPFRQFTECFLVPHDEWVQMPSSHTNAWHVGFRLAAGHIGTIRSLTLSYQRVDAFFYVVTNPSIMTAMTTTFTPIGNSAAATIGYNDNRTPPPSAVTMTQAGSARRETGTCTFPTEATTCFRHLSPDQPVTVKVLHAPDARAVGLSLAWPS